MYMGQSNDITTVKKKVEKIDKNNDIILYGCSRGGATIIKYLAEHNPSNIAAIVLDASPADMPATTHSKLANLGIPFSYDNAIFSTIFPGYPSGSSTPLQVIKKIKNKELPILLIHSQDDAIVPFAHALKLYKKFKDQGFNNVHLAPIKQGRHSFLLQDPEVKNQDLKAVHSFYSKYQLPHNHDYSNHDASQYRYNLDQASREINDYELNLQSIYQSSKHRNIFVATMTAATYIAYICYKHKK